MTEKIFQRYNRVPVLLLITLLLCAFALPCVQADCQMDLDTVRSEKAFHENAFLSCQNSQTIGEAYESSRPLRVDALTGRNAVLTVTSAGTSNPRMAPDSLDSGPVPVSATGRAQTITGMATPPPTPCIDPPGGVQGRDLARGGTCSYGTVPARNTSCTIAIIFSPADVGSRYAMLPVITIPSGAPLATSLAGTGSGIISISNLPVDPLTPSPLFSGLDENDISRSTPSGNSWDPATLAPVNTRIKVLLLKPGDSTNLFAGTSGGAVFRSTESGVTLSAGSAEPACLNVHSRVSDSSGKHYAGNEGRFFTSPDCTGGTNLNGGLP